MSEGNVQTVTRVLDAFNAGDLPSFKALFAADAEIVPLRAALEDTIFTGPNAPEEFFAASRDTWTSLDLGIEEIRGSGDCLLVLGSFRARGRLSGAKIEIDIGWVVRFLEGAIRSIRVFADRADAIAEAGLSEEAVSKPNAETG